MRLLCLKVVLLVALTTTKRVSELQAFSVSPECLRFAQDGGTVFLRPNAVFVPKNLHVSEQPVELEAFRPPPFASPEDERLHRLCPVRTLGCYVRRTQQVRTTSQLFVTHGPGLGGKPASRPTLSRWLVEAIRLAYTSRGVGPLEGIRAHSTRGVSSSRAVRGASPSRRSVRRLIGQLLRPLLLFTAWMWLGLRWPMLSWGWRTPRTWGSEAGGWGAAVFRSFFP